MVNEPELINMSVWFDPYNQEHIDAYKHLMDVGMWPKGFIPENVYLPPGWQFSVMNKLADAWVEHMSTKDREMLQ